jgi:uncharacterized protein YjbI with pentapeptide repeats
MDNEEQLNLLQQDMKAWNRWRQENREIRPNLHGANLSGANLNQANLLLANLSGANLSGAELYRAELHGANLSGANLSLANLSGADLTKADLTEADLSKADLCGANLSGANLFETNFYRANLTEAHLTMAKLFMANLTEATLFNTYLSAAELNQANLRKANLMRAQLNQANLSGANLTEADLGGANLSLANLTGADLNQASMVITSFGDVDLSTVKGLETVIHKGPSYIDIHTIYRSKGNIPEAFLRGAGVPDTFITYVASLTGQAIQYYSCFISYSSNDEDFAKRLHADLQQNSVRCWFAPEDMKGGGKLYPQIDQAIRVHDKLLLVLSERSLESEWVKTEIRRARQAEIKEKQRKLFPIRLVNMDTLKAWECFDADTGKDLAVEIREYFIPDFTHWSYHEAYQPAFNRLLRDLKANG